MTIDLTKLIDLDLLSYFKSKLDTLFATKVDKVDGKGLSSNDYTGAEKTKLANVEAGAQVNVLEGIQRNGVTVTPTNKIANINVPTKTSDLTNDSNFAADASYVHTDNNYTDNEKTKLGGVAAGAQVNVIETVKVNGTARTVTAKAVDITVPTKTSDITNDSGFITAADVPEGAAATTTTPAMDGTAAVGVETTFARGDHVHPKDTSKADLASPEFTGTPKAPTAASGTNTTQIATTAFVTGAVSTKANSADVYTKTEIDNKLSSTFKPGGSVTFQNLPALSAGNLGKIVNVTDSFTTTSSFVEGAGKTYPAGTNVAIVDVGTAGSPSYKYDIQGSFFDLSGYAEDSDFGLATTGEIDALFT